MTPAHRIEVVNGEDGRLHLDNFPFQEGQAVEFMVLPMPNALHSAQSWRGPVVRYDRATNQVAEGERLLFR